MQHLASHASFQLLPVDVDDGQGPTAVVAETKRRPHALKKPMPPVTGRAEVSRLCRLPPATRGAGHINLAPVMG